jgi:hypothetical protein
MARHDRDREASGSSVVGPYIERELGWHMASSSATTRHADLVRLRKVSYRYLVGGYRPQERMAAHKGRSTSGDRSGIL